MTQSATGSSLADPVLTPPSAARGKLLLPLLFAAILTLWVAVDSMLFRLRTPYPLDPWESMYVLEGYRALQGQPLYENWRSGHATHLYGPLSTYAVAAIYSFTGPNLYAGRAISLVAGVVAGVIFILAFVERRTWAYVLIAAALFASLHLKCLVLFTDTRPDALAFLLATLGLMAAYRAQNLDSIAWYLAAASLMVLAFLFKQTYAVAALVPPLAVLLVRPMHLRRQVLRSLLPLLFMLAAGAVLKFGFPVVWYYVVRAPRLYAINPHKLLVAIGAIFMANPLVVALVAASVAGVRLDSQHDRKTMWILAAAVIGGLMGTVALAKVGGNANSMMLAYAPLIALCILKLPTVMDRLAAVSLPGAVRAGYAVLLGIAMLATSFGQLRAGTSVIYTNSNNSPSYSAAIELARSLPGIVVCPDEPTITFFARGQVERSLEAFLWVTGFTQEVEPWLISNTRRVDWIITVSNPLYPSRTSPLLPKLGFRKIRTDQLDSTYGLWRRINPRSTSRPRDATTE